MVACAYITDGLAAHKLMIPINVHMPLVDASAGGADAIYQIGAEREDTAAWKA
jgi:hypothetical protein